MSELWLMPLLAGLMIALSAGPLGCFVVWNRMAYFGDTLAHSALLGVSLALFFSLPVNTGIVLSCFFVAALLLFLNGNRFLPRDTLLGILAHGSLAIGLVCASFLEGLRLDLMAFLFGDILSVGKEELIMLAACSVLVLALLVMHWKAFLLISINEELAQAEGLAVGKYKTLLVFLLALLVALSIKLIGVLLIGALLIIPAASARVWANSSKLMAFLAWGFASAAVIFGLALSWQFDSPTGPSMVVVSFILFVLSLSFSRAFPHH